VEKLKEIEEKTEEKSADFNALISEKEKTLSDSDSNVQQSSTSETFGDN